MLNLSETPNTNLNFKVRMIVHKTMNWGLHRFEHIISCVFYDSRHWTKTRFLIFTDEYIG